MNLFDLHPDTKNINDRSVDDPILYNEPAYYSNECSEFLDEDFRMRNLPLMYTEVSVAAGCPKDLL